MARRQAPEVWSVRRREVYLRDCGLCQSPVKPPVCQGKAEPMALDNCHVDHIIPLCRGGSNHASNLRLLCRVCHALREDTAHTTVRADALQKGLLPLDWRSWTWE